MTDYASPNIDPTLLVEALSTVPYRLDWLMDAASNPSMPWEELDARERKAPPSDNPVAQNLDIAPVRSVLLRNPSLPFYLLTHGEDAQRFVLRRLASELGDRLRGKVTLNLRLRRKATSTLENKLTTLLRSLGATTRQTSGSSVGSFVGLYLVGGDERGHKTLPTVSFFRDLYRTLANGYGLGPAAIHRGLLEVADLLVASAEPPTPTMPTLLADRVLRGDEKSAG